IHQHRVAWIMQTLVLHRPLTPCRDVAKKTRPFIPLLTVTAAGTGQPHRGHLRANGKRSDSRYAHSSSWEAFGDLAEMLRSSYGSGWVIIFEQSFLATCGG
ncbi:MAG: hypothetical protein ACREMA_10085, partial [Longimicrobiales bacterium]